MQLSTIFNSVRTLTNRCIGYFINVERLIRQWRNLISRKGIRATSIGSNSFATWYLINHSLCKKPRVSDEYDLWNGSFVSRWPFAVARGQRVLRTYILLPFTLYHVLTTSTYVLHLSRLPRVYFLPRFFDNSLVHGYPSPDSSSILFRSSSAFPTLLHLLATCPGLSDSVSRDPHHLLRPASHYLLPNSSFPDLNLATIFSSSYK